MAAAADGAARFEMSRNWLVTTRNCRKADPRPTLLVNPGLEIVFLEPGRSNGCHTGYNRHFDALGLVPPGRRLRFDRPVPGATARVTGDSLAVMPPDTNRGPTIAGGFVKLTV